MASTQRTESVALIEEKVETGLRDMLNAYQPGYMLGGPNRDELNKRFTIRMNAPLPQFNTGTARAFEATDNTNPGREAYALVLEGNFNYRMTSIERLNGWQHPHILTLLGHGSVYLTSQNKAHQVIVFDRPHGPSLSEIVAIKRITQEHIIKDVIIEPLSKALGMFKEKGIQHGCINPKNIFIKDTLVLGECVSEPPGLSQDYIYEPVERMMCDPLSKGIGNEKIDVYAIGILAYDMVYGLDHLRRFPKEALIEKILNEGIYNVLARNRDFPDGLQDFFRGIFCDNPAERWGIEQLHLWVNGKRFNMINPSGSHDAVRPINFNEQDYYSQRALAYALHKNWREAQKNIRQLKIDRWAEMSLHRPELSERILRVTRPVFEPQVTEQQTNDTLTRVIGILDPAGPVCTHLQALRPEGIGYALANAVQRHLGSELQEILDLIENDIGTFWNDLTEGGKTIDSSQMIWKMQRCKMFIRNKSLGFGLERVLYELNPHLPCQSELVVNYHITNLHDMLKVLDTLAKKMAPDAPLIDRHIAAFAASKIDMSKEIRLLDLSSIPQLASNEELVMMRILAKAQQKQDKIPLPGLAIWAAMRVETMLDAIHNRDLRKRMKLQLKRVISNGRLNDLLNLIINRDVAVRDYQGFAHAIALHQVNGQRIERLKNPKVVERMAADLGGRIAALMAYTILSVTVYMVVAKYMYW